MNSLSAKPSTSTPMLLLSRLLLPPRNEAAAFERREELKRELRALKHVDFQTVLDLAQTNHVIVRGLRALLALALEQPAAACAEWAETALEAESARIENAISYLYGICAAFRENNYNVTVIKSLDHWPDIGSDLDLYTNAAPNDVLTLMTKGLGAKIATRSWGDRLAQKWNFFVPGLPEAVEIHVGRLGQMGEQSAVAASLPERGRKVVVGGLEFHVASVSDRIAISTLQRMYRHFYFRLCDVIDTATLADSGEIDYENLRSRTLGAGIWEGAATYLAIVSDYVERYRGAGLELPVFVRSAARFGGDQIHYARGFLRVPIMPESARLYGTQLAGVLSRGEFENGARLSLLPWLAAAAVVGQKLTGSDKGIW